MFTHQEESSSDVIPNRLTFKPQSLGSITPIQLSTILDYLNQHPTITQLIIHHKMQEAAAIQLIRALPHTQLTLLDMSYSGMSITTLKALTHVLPQSPLRMLRVRGNFIGIPGAIALATAMVKSQLEVLNLGDNRISTQGAKVLAEALLKPNQLKELYLSANHIGKEGVKSMIEALPHCGLTTLDLSTEGLEDDEAIHMAQVLPNCQLTRLYLNNYTIGEAGANAILKSILRSQLVELELRSPRIDPATQRAIQVAIRDNNERLRRIALVGSAMQARTIFQGFIQPDNILSLHRLPPELWECIFSYLSPPTLKDNVAFRFFKRPSGDDAEHIQESRDSRKIRSI